MRIRTFLVLCALIVGGGGTAYGQGTVDASTKDRVATALLRASYGTTLLVQMYDARTTVDAIKSGAREVNPLIAPFTTRSELLVAAGLVRATAIDLAVHSIAQRNKVVAMAVSAAVNSGYMMIAAHNRSVVDRMRAQPAPQR